jgi:hypothetical protein
LLPAAHDHLDGALITASRPLPKEGQEEAKAEAIISASFLQELINILYSSPSPQDVKQFFPFHADELATSRL